MKKKILIFFWFLTIILPVAYIFLQPWNYYLNLPFGNISSGYIFYFFPPCLFTVFYFIFMVPRKKTADIFITIIKKTFHKLLLILGDIIIKTFEKISVYFQWLHNNVKNNQLLVIILSIALALRLFHLDFYDLWIDEILRVSFAKTVTLFKTISPADPPLQLLILKYINLILGNSDFFLRLPSVLFSTLSVLMTYFVAKTIFNKKVGLIAAFLLAIAGFSIERSQEVKAYSLLTFFPLLSTFLLFSLVTSGFKFKKTLLLIISLLLTVYAAYIGIYPNLIILSYLLILGIKYFLSIKVKINFWLKLLGLFPLIPLSYFILKSFVFNPARMLYLVPISLSSPNQYLDRLYYLRVIMSSFSNTALIPYLFFFIAAFIFSIFQFKKKFIVWIYFYLWIFSFLALRVLFLIYSPFQETLPQYYIYLLPFYLMLVATGIVFISQTLCRLLFRSQPPFIEGTFIIILTLFLVRSSYESLWVYYFLPRQWAVDWKSSTRYLENHSQPGDILVSPPRLGENVNLATFYFDYKKFGVLYSIFPQQGKGANWYVSLVGNFPSYEDWAVSDMVHPGRRSYPAWVFQLSYLGKGKQIVKMQNKKEWQITDRYDSPGLNKAIDGDKNSFWLKKSSLERGDFVEIDIGKIATLVGIETECPINSNYPKDYLVETSIDGKNWEIVQTASHFDDPFYYYQAVTPFKPTSVRFIKLTNLQRDKFHWQINEINISEVVDPKIPRLYQKDSPFTGIVVEDKDAKNGFAKFVPINPNIKALPYGEKQNLLRGFYRLKYRVKTDNVQSKFYTYVVIDFDKDGVIRPQPVILNIKELDKYEEYYLDFYHEGNVPVVPFIISYGERNYWFEYPEFIKLK